MPIQKGPANLGTGSVDSTELASTLDLSAKTVTYRTIVAGDIASNAITTAKLATDLVVTHALGSASTPSITTTGDTDTGVWFPAANTLAASTGGTERMRIDSSGNVGIGTASPSDKLNMVVSSSSVDPVFGGTSNQGIRLQNSNATVGNFTSILNVNSAGTLSSMIAFRNVDQNTPNTAGAIDFVTRNGGNLYRAMTVSQDGNLQFNSGYGSAATAYGCRAWVNFNGTGTVAINASGNVSSITDNGAGNYTVHFTTAMPDANYCALGSAGNTSSGSLGIVNAANRGTGSCQIFPIVGGVDASCIDIAIFR